MSWEFDPDIAMNRIGDMLEVMVGEDLSFLPNPDGTDSDQRSIIIGYTDGVEPPLPFIAMRFEGSDDNEGYLLDSDLVEEENPDNPLEPFYYPRYNTTLNYHVSIRCEGEGSHKILSKVRSLLRVNRYKDSIKDSIYSTIKLINPIRYTPDLLSDEYREVNTFVMTLSTVDSFVDIEGGVIDTINYSNETKVCPEDTTPIISNGTVTSIP